MKRLLDRIDRWIFPQQIQAKYPYFDRGNSSFPLVLKAELPSFVDEKFKEKNTIEASYSKAGILKGYKKLVNFFDKKESFIGHITDQTLYHHLQEAKRSLPSDYSFKPSGEIMCSEVYFLHKHTYTGCILPLRKLNLSPDSFRIQQYRDSTSISLRHKPTSNISSSHFKPFYLPNVCIDPSQADIDKLKVQLAEFLHKHPLTIEVEDYGIFTPYKLTLSHLSSDNDITSFEFHTLRIERIINNRKDKELNTFLDEHFEEDVDMYVISDVDGCLDGNSLI